jgi:hypothetical protein
MEPAAVSVSLTGLVGDRNRRSGGCGPPDASGSLCCLYWAQRAGSSGRCRLPFPACWRLADTLGPDDLLVGRLPGRLGFDCSACHQLMCILGRLYSI